MTTRKLPYATTNALNDEALFQKGLNFRHLRARVWRGFYLLSLVVAGIALIALLLNIANSAFGYVIYTPNPNIPAGVNAESLTTYTEAQLFDVLKNNLRFAQLRVLPRDLYLQTGQTLDTSLPTGELFPNIVVPESIANITYRELDVDGVITLLDANMEHDAIYDLLVNRVLEPDLLAENFSLYDSIFNYPKIEAILADDYDGEGRIEFKSWVTFDFLTEPLSSSAEKAGIRTAILGSMWVIALTVLISFPIGVGAAIYLEEYATHSWYNRIIETNIRNLSGVPSIIYGLLGLAMFVRILSDITQGRTILSAALTMSLLILPVIIINSQEAIRAVPSTIREASYGLGATKWQTIWNQVLPAAIPGILTGTILALSRAIGETAPLIVIGASTFIQSDPTGPFSRFTVIPIQIYQWTSRPQAEFQAVAAGAIVVLMVLLLLMNATAIITRQRFRKKLQG